MNFYIRNYHSIFREIPTPSKNNTYSKEQLLVAVYDTNLNFTVIRGLGAENLPLFTSYCTVCPNYYSYPTSPVKVWAGLFSDQPDQAIQLSPGAPTFGHKKSDWIANPWGMINWDVNNIPNFINQLCQFYISGPDYYVFSQTKYSNDMNVLFYYITFEDSTEEYFSCCFYSGNDPNCDYILTI